MVFRSYNRSAHAVLPSFALLYLYYYDSYIYLSAFKASSNIKRAAEMELERYLDKRCRGNNRQQEIKCVIERLAAQYNIAILFARYDEGVRSEGEIDLSSELAGEEPR
ncbi:MAG: hypothetical protein HY696_06050 [Deltaproteobacteria bacterium]|nr:hypothetical protein [Deltaproteobacteria bacterium]